MRANLPYLQQRFDHFNRLIFGGQLPALPILLSRATTFAGKCEHRTRRTLLGSIEPYDFRLRFSVLFDFTPDELDDVIIHEMIHYHIAFHRLRDASAHGPLFRQIMDDINRRYQRHVTISDHLSREQAAAVNSQRRTVHVIAAVRFADGRPGVKVLPRIRQRIQFYRTTMLAQPTITGIRLYLSDDPFFNRYPNSAALSVYKITEAELTDHLREARELEI